MSHVATRARWNSITGAVTAFAVACRLAATAEVPSVWVHLRGRRAAV